MSSLLYVFIGGGAGCVARYGIGHYFSGSGGQFPIGTFIANALACGILGFLLGAEAKSNLQPSHTLLLMTGFCGGFSTFSTFSAEALRLIQDGHLSTALSYVGGSLFIGVVAVILGFRIYNLSL